jgi:hypothetical protein
MAQVNSPYIWYPAGYPGSAYDLRKILAWGEGPVPGTVVVRFDGLGTAATVTFDQAAFEAALNGTEVPPTNTVAPTATGVGYVGQILTGTTGTWIGVPPPTITYKWQRFTGGMWVDIPLATSLTYVVPLADEGVPLRFYVTGTNVVGTSSVGSNAIEQWVPTDLGASLAAWFDGYDSSTFTLVGSNVSQWRDKSGNNRHISQGTASDQPIYSATSFNSTPAVTAAGNGDVLVASALWSPEPTNLSMIGGVIRDTQNSDNGSSYRFFMSSPMAVDPGVRCVWAPRGTTGPVPIDSIRSGILSANTSNQAIQASTTNATTILSATLPDDAGYVANCKIWLNGTVGSSPGGLPPSSGSSTRFTLFGDNSNNARSIIGTISDAIITDYVIGTTERQKGEGYIAWRRNIVGNLPIGHPYKLVPPEP